ncbi:MAG: hypothetical protein LBU79_09840 [Planctomycetota bacterium]|nr:hypothetical protein [Planctomycetota bacterium]
MQRHLSGITLDVFFGMSLKWPFTILSISSSDIPSIFAPWDSDIPCLAMSSSIPYTVMHLRPIPSGSG